MGQGISVCLLLTLQWYLFHLMLNSVHVVIHLPQKMIMSCACIIKALLSFNCNRSRNNLISLTIFFFLGSYTSATPSCAVTMRRSNFFTTSCPLMLWITSVSPTSSQPSVSLTLYSMNNQLLWISVHCVTFVFPLPLSDPLPRGGCSE